MLYLALVALLSLGVATAVRGTAGAITGVLTLLYAFPIVAQLVSDPHWQQRLERYGPMEAGLSVQHTMRLDELPIGPWPGLGVHLRRIRSALGPDALPAPRRVRAGIAMA